MRLILLGAPGAGKGTQAKLLSEILKSPHISTGDIFRQNIAEKTELGVKAKEYIDQGKLVPDDVTNGLMAGRISEPDTRNGFLLDGYPRTIAQAEFLDRVTAERGVPVQSVVNIDVPENIIVKRITGRRMCPKCGKIYHVDSLRPMIEGVCDVCGSSLVKREDDNEATVRSRLEYYYAQTAPLIEYYAKQGKLLTVDGNKAAESTLQDIRTALKF